MNWSDALKLGRVSNLPTVWTNTLAGAVIVGGAVTESWPMVPLLIAMTLFYIAGMYLNDAFDAEIDAAERPERAIPSGRVKRSTVFGLGFIMMAAGLVLIWYIGEAGELAAGPWLTLAALGLAGAIILYDWYHKANPLSPVVMGVCRALVYLTAALCFAFPLGEPIWAGAILLLCYLIGLTYVAKQENLGEVKNMWPLIFLAAPVVYGAMLAQVEPLVWGYLAIFTAWALRSVWLVRRRGPGDIPRAVVSLIAGICLFDAIVIAGAGQPGMAALGVVGFVLTLALQRFVPGT